MCFRKSQLLLHYIHSPKGKESLLHYIILLKVLVGFAFLKLPSDLSGCNSSQKTLDEFKCFIIYLMKVQKAFW